MSVVPIIIAVVFTVPQQMEKLDAMLHIEIERKAEMEKARNWIMTFVAWAVTIVLHFIAFFLKLSSLLRSVGGAYTGLFRTPH